MKFDDVVNGIGTLTDLRRTASAYVVDYRDLDEKELREALVKVRAQYLAQENILESFERALHGQDSLKRRVLSQLFIVDILLNEHGYTLGKRETGDRIIAFEQTIVNRSNEMDLVKLACGKKGSPRYNDLELYNFVLGVAWEFEETKSRDEANLLRKLRMRLKINDWDHRLLEAKLGKYPKPNNELHTHAEIEDVRKFLQSSGLVFQVRDEDWDDFDVIPEEIGDALRFILGIEIRPDNFRKLLRYKSVRRKSFLKNALTSAGFDHGQYDTLEDLIERIVQNMKPSELLSPWPPRGLSNDQLYEWCTDLALLQSGSKSERVQRIIEHYDSLQIVSAEPDQRALWYDVFESLAFRDHKLLRGQEVISKDIEIEAKFEEATTFIFETKLNHTPLKQPGVNRPDGLLSFRDMYLMWDCKSKETPGEVSLKEHIKQFDQYIEKSDKPVPIFLVVAPAFTEDSEIAAIQYSAEHLNRSIVLITATELKSLAEEWSSEKNKRHDEPFPLGLIRRPGRFDRRLLGRLV